MSDDQVRDVGELARDEGFKLNIGKAIAILATTAFIIFALQNTADTTVTFLGIQFSLSFWLLGVIIFLLGWVVGYASKTRKVRRARKALR